MESSFFLKGLIIGIVLATPIGPAAALCVQRTLSEGKVYGFASGLGAAVADAIYAIITAFGFALILNFLTEKEVWLRVTGGVFLLCVGLRVFFSKPVKHPAAPDVFTGILGAFGSTFFITITNPVMIFSSAFIFAVLGVASSIGNKVSTSLLVLGVFIGSALLWFILCGAAAIFSDRFSRGNLVWVNRISGIIICVSGLFAFSNLVKI